MILGEHVTKDGILSGKVAIVTGASRGIGRSIALVLAREGAAVGLVARTAEQLAAVCEEIGGLGGRAIALSADVSVERDVIQVVKEAVETFGRLDILVNNAGLGIFGPLQEMRVQDWDRVMAVNARGPFLFCREAIPFLREQSSSHIVNIASAVGHEGYANQSAYGASKHALLGMTKALAREVQSDGIRVHAVSPGGVDTGLIGDARPDLDRSVLMKPEDIADIVLFLVTRQGNAVIDEVRVRRAVSTPWA